MTFLNSWCVPEMYCTVMTKFVFSNSWCAPEIFCDGFYISSCTANWYLESSATSRIGFLEHMICIWNLQWWQNLSSWTAYVYHKCIVQWWPSLKLEELICTWNFQWWQSLSSWRADLYLESSVMAKSVVWNSWCIPGIFSDDQVFLNGCRVPGIFSDDQVYLLKELICTWNLQWWPSLSS